MKKGLTPAALISLLNGDVEDFITATTPGGIEAQEAKGQKDFVKSETLPKKVNFCHDSVEELYKKLGIKILGEADDLFNNVQLPSGWIKRPTDHSMWSELVDDKGRVRAHIFYKAAYYDRSAHIGFSLRYTSSYERLAEENAPYTKDEKYVATIRKDGKEIWRSEIPMGYNEVHEFAKKTLLEKYPNAASESAYWDEE